MGQVEPAPESAEAAAPGARSDAEVPAERDDLAEAAVWAEAEELRIRSCLLSEVGWVAPG